MHHQALLNAVLILVSTSGIAVSLMRRRKSVCGGSSSAAGGSDGVAHVDGGAATQQQQGAALVATSDAAAVLGDAPRGAALLSAMLGVGTQMLVVGGFVLWVGASGTLPPFLVRGRQAMLTFIMYLLSTWVAGGWQAGVAVLCFAVAVERLVGVLGTQAR